MSKLELAGIIPGIAFRNSNSPETMQECTVDESRYNVQDNYKITLKALDPSYGQEHFYISDLESLIENNPTHKVYVLDGDNLYTLK
jgi:hypothetical protein